LVGFATVSTALPLRQVKILSTSRHQIVSAHSAKFLYWVPLESARLQKSKRLIPVATRPESLRPVSIDFSAGGWRGEAAPAPMRLRPFRHHLPDLRKHGASLSSAGS
jgi:hypothetical protein